MRHILYYLLCLCFLLTPKLSGQNEQPVPLKKAAVLPWSLNQSLELGGGVALASKVGHWLSASGLYELPSENDLYEQIDKNEGFDPGCKTIECLKKTNQFLKKDYLITGLINITDTEIGALYQVKLVVVSAAGEEYVFEGEAAGSEKDLLVFLEGTVRDLLIIPFEPKKVEVVIKDNSLKILSEPQGALVYLDDSKVGHAPLKLDKLFVGKHRLKLEMPQYETWEEEFVMGLEEQKVIEAQLIKNLGRIIIQTVPDNAWVFLDGEKIGKTPLNLAVPAASYQLMLKRLGYSMFLQKITVVEGIPLKLEIELLPGMSEKELLEIKKLKKIVAKEEKIRVAAEKRGKEAGRAVTDGLVVDGLVLEEDAEVKKEKKVESENALRLKTFLLIKKRRQAARQKILDNQGRQESEKQFLAQILSQHQKACAEKGMVFVQTQEITMQDLELIKAQRNPELWARGFCIDPMEVTVAEFTNYLPSFISSEYSFKDDHPASRVNYEQAEGFCKHLGKRLCSRNEWTKACQGRYKNIYTYGRKFEPKRCRTNLTHTDGAAVVGSYADCRNEMGVFDMNGNVWEWTADTYFPKTRVVRGGSWVDKATSCEYLGAVDPMIEDDTFGIRCCADYVPELTMPKKQQAPELK